jgi:hypothetical protein
MSGRGIAGSSLGRKHHHRISHSPDSNTAALHHSQQLDVTSALHSLSCRAPPSAGRCGGSLLLSGDLTLDWRVLNSRLVPFGSCSPLPHPVLEQSVVTWDDNSSFTPYVLVYQLPTHTRHESCCHCGIFINARTSCGPSTGESSRCLEHQEWDGNVGRQTTANPHAQVVPPPPSCQLAFFGMLHRQGKQFYEGNRITYAQSTSARPSAAQLLRRCVFLFTGLR